MRFQLASLTFSLAAVIPSIPAALQPAPALAAPITVSAEISSRLDAAVSKVLADTHAPGAAVAVQREGAAPYIKGYGYANVLHTAVVTPSTRFEIGSVTKQFTAAAILQLVEAKRISLDDRVEKFIKVYPKAGPLTLRQLLWQVSGLPNYSDIPHFVTIASHKPASFAAIVALVSNKPLEFKPGSRWGYSNTNYILLGRVIEVASEMPFDTYIKSHIFKAADMTQSGTIADEAHIPDMATGYYADKKGLHASPKFRSGWAWSAGNIVSTAGDMLKWDEALFAGKIVSPQDVSAMTSPGMLANGKSTSYGFGWIIDKQSGHKRIWHNGGRFGFGASNSVFPGDHLRMVVLINDVAVAPSSIATKVFESLSPDVAKSDCQAARGEDAAVTVRAKEWLHRLQSGNIDRSQLTKQMSDALTPASLISLKQQLGALGEPASFIYKGKQAAGGDTAYLYRIAFSSLTATMTFTLNTAGKIGGLFLRPE